MVWCIDWRMGRVSPAVGVVATLGVIYSGGGGRGGGMAMDVEEEVDGVAAMRSTDAAAPSAALQSAEENDADGAGR